MLKYGVQLNRENRHLDKNLTAKDCKRTRHIPAYERTANPNATAQPTGNDPCAVYGKIKPRRNACA